MEVRGWAWFLSNLLMAKADSLSGSPHVRFADAINEAGCVIVTKEALDRVSRGALGRRRMPGAGAKVQAP